jgi:hypothetical protein
MWKRLPVPTLAALLLLPVGAVPELFALPEPMVVEGQNVPGVGLVTRIDNVAINGLADWLVEADTDFANTDQDQVLLNAGGLVLREDDSLPSPPGARLDSFDSININENEESGWNFFLDGTSGSNDDSGIYFNTTLVIQESDISTAPEFGPNTPYIGFFDVKMNDVDQMMVIASVDDPNIAGTVDRAVVRLDLDNLGTLLAERVIAKEGDILPGQVEAVVDFGTGPHLSAFNNAGDVLFLADLAGATTTDGALYLNNILLAQEGSPSPDPGRNYETLLPRGLDLNASGGYVFKANLDGNTADDDVIIKDGAILVREGQNLASIGPFQLENLGLSSGPVYIDDNGNVLWYGDWDDPDTDSDSGLFLNEELIVQEGTLAGGTTLDTINNGTDAFMLSDNGEWLIFEGSLVGGINAAFVVDLRDPTGVEGQEGVPPVATALWSSPNPFLGATQIHYALARDGRVELSIYDLSGRMVARLHDGRREAGSHAVAWDGKDEMGRSLGAGTYFIRLSSRSETLERKLVRVR